MIYSEIDKLLDVIREVHSQHADDLCWMDIDKIFAAAGLPVPDRSVGDQCAMLANCAKYIGVMCKGGKWKSYAELEEEVKLLKEKVDELECTLDDEEAAHQDTLRLLQLAKGTSNS